MNGVPKFKHLTILNFFSERQRREFKALDRRLQLFAWAISGWSWDMFGKPVVVTEVLRTVEEQTVKHPLSEGDHFQALSEHEGFLAFNFRTVDFGADDMLKIINFLHDSYDFIGKVRPAIAYEEARSHGLDIHVQVNAIPDRWGFQFKYGVPHNGT